MSTKLMKKLILKVKIQLKVRHFVKKIQIWLHFIQESGYKTQQ